ncbi:spore germination protein [Paenibacillus doosanensis]|uniref:Spore germination protein GerPF n=1 Tax=Paenibacillus konkukensis TaxID=2020716 RepID=A0ABY4RI65_9BACL|nr:MULTISPECIES: spore germination protein [Paenibacillus]MCS7464412.1 spore germination protein [Paenibacillus doosanensis]UQZ82156.1 putative spore germination protein GerPF [Paenibacillus konkukensis]
MPAIVQSVNINSNSGTVNFGDTLSISPTTNSKQVSGQGGSNTGNVVNTLNGVSINNVSDAALLDQPTVAV